MKCQRVILVPTEISCVSPSSDKRIRLSRSIHRPMSLYKSLGLSETRLSKVTFSNFSLPSFTFGFIALNLTLSTIASLSFKIAMAILFTGNVWSSWFITINIYSGAWTCSLDRVPVPVFLVGKCLSSFTTSKSISTFDSVLSLDFRAAFTKTIVESQLGRLFKVE